MDEEKTTANTAGRSSDPAPSAVVVPAAGAGNPTNTNIIDTWARDLVQNLAELRETGNYNRFQAAIADLKARIQ